MNLPTSSFQTTRGFTYSYIHLPRERSIATGSVNADYLLILHGFPSIPTDFYHQIAHLHSLGYSIVAPYLLGYSPTSAPTDPNAYRMKYMIQDLVELLDNLDITKPVHAIGHDWGVTLLSRFEFYHPGRLSDKLAFLTIAPVPFGQEFDLQFVLDMTQRAFGYCLFGYQKFFMDGIHNGKPAKLLGAKHDRMEMLMFAKNSDRLFKDHFCAVGGLEKWLQGHEQVPMLDGIPEEVFEKRRETLAPMLEQMPFNDGEEQSCGYAGPLNWYASLNENLNVADERAVSGWEQYKTDKSVLLVTCNRDPSSPEIMHVGMAHSYVFDVQKQLTLESIDTGHFPMLELGQHVNIILETFFEH